MASDLLILGIFLLINGLIQILLFRWWIECNGMKAVFIMLGGLAHGAFTVLMLVFALGTLLEHQPPS